MCWGVLIEHWRTCSRFWKSTELYPSYCKIDVLLVQFVPLVKFSAGFVAREHRSKEHLGWVLVSSPCGEASSDPRHNLPALIVVPCLTRRCLTLVQALFIFEFRGCSKSSVGIMRSAHSMKARFKGAGVTIFSTCSFFFYSKGGSTIVKPSAVVAQGNALAVSFCQPPILI
jgi:hypothetical protein